MYDNILKELIDKTNGRFFSVTFRKADGSIRKANGKDYYLRLLRGGESTLKESRAVPFVDRNKGSFIAANADRIISFRCGSLTYPTVG